jgi:Putative 2OG-Fe(II) oxygenase
VPHIHPAGGLGSALHLCASAKNGSDGMLEIGRPPNELSALNLEPLRTIQPLLGQLVIFPSWMYHGTTPFGKVERLSMAFDFA